MNDVANLSLLAIPLLLCAFIWRGCGVGSCSRWRWDLGCGAGFFPEPTGSVVVVHGLSCSLAHGILVPRLGIEPASLALEGRFLTTGPPGKSFPSYSFLFLIFVVDGCLFTRVSEFISAESIWLSPSKIRVFSLIINLYYKYLFFSPGEIFTLNLDKNLSSKQLWNVGWCNKPG